MYNVESSSPIHTLRPGDDGFYFSPDNISLVARAGFEIDYDCPRNYKLILVECINNGWIKPIANCTDQERLWQKLTK